ncbi:tetraacyldisaccharide 4'-kinase [Lutimonas halocynthiae]|uniref:tetraacyldisaccharide 4'-kinase n=1 Tax=Lutimonas halocynthiae TaxID=1446477 RepID=UPI0025B5A2E9|nr:tetraacyldisaccharide 4'-kinase [Lutimonas halocynthiae]MDN3643443.1 tetraacyldisaccharide 4'-kinase [Lutimonas halocynthiae]
MNSLRKILFPFALIYGLITSIRNLAFDIGFLRSRTFDVPTIVVGNLSVGGTGKSPMIEYLVGLFQEKYKMAVLSRGYGRKTKGFLLANQTSTAKDVGDEPYQFHRKFQDLEIAVDEKRVRGMEKLLNAKPELDLVLLDDAYQHRYVKAGCYILLTSFDKLYINDFMLPAGNLREPRSGSKRAQIIIVSKCPDHLNAAMRDEIEKKINPNSNQKLFFSRIAYDAAIINNKGRKSLEELKNRKVLLITGIADPSPMEDFLKRKLISFEHLKYGDHQFIGEAELLDIRRKLSGLTEEEKIIITTEKDYVRNFIDIELPVFYLPIKTEIIEDSKIFNDLIQNYV